MSPKWNVLCNSHRQNHECTINMRDNLHLLNELRSEGEDYHASKACSVASFPVYNFVTSTCRWLQTNIQKDLWEGCGRWERRGEGWVSWHPWRCEGDGFTGSLIVWLGDGSKSFGPDNSMYIHWCFIVDRPNGKTKTATEQEMNVTSRCFKQVLNPAAMLYSR